MSDASQEAEKAKEQAGQAGHQARAAAKSTGRAAKAAAEPVADAVADEVRDTAHKVEATAEDAVRTVQTLDKVALSKGVLSLAISVGAGAYAFVQFRQVASGRSQGISSS